MSNKGRPTSYKIRKTFAHAMELDLYNVTGKYCKSIGRNVNEVSNTALIWYLKSKNVSLPEHIDLPEHIQMMDGIMKCKRCASQFDSYEEAKDHPCIKEDISEKFKSQFEVKKQ